MPEKKKIHQANKAVTHQESNTRTSFPSLQKMFQESWELFKKTFISYLKLFAVGVGIMVGGAILGVLIAIPLFFSSGGNVQRLFLHPTPFEIAGLGLIFVWLVAYIVLMVLYTLFSSISYLFVLDEKKNIPLKNLYDRAKSLFKPYFVANTLSGLAVVGSMVVLLVPGLIVAVLFSFVANVVVLEEKKGIQALKRSYQIVMGNFWGIVLRIIVIQAFVILSTKFVDYLAKESDFMMVLSQVYSFVVEWFVIVYSFILFRQAQSLSVTSVKPNIHWIWLVSVVGWILLFLILLFAFIGFFNGEQMQLFAKELTSN